MMVIKLMSIRWCQCVGRSLSGSCHYNKICEWDTYTWDLRSITLRRNSHLSRIQMDVNYWSSYYLLLLHWKNQIRANEWIRSFQQQGINSFCMNYFQFIFRTFYNLMVFTIFFVIYDNYFVSMEIIV